VEQKLIQTRGPDSIFVLESLKDVYVFNFSFVVLQFVILRIMRIIFGLVQERHRTLEKFYTFFRIKSLWWTILLGIVESNIAVITFYCFIQFNACFTFEIFGKFNLVFGTCMAFFVFSFTFVFYPMLIRYET